MTRITHQTCLRWGSVICLSLVLVVTGCDSGDDSGPCGGASIPLEAANCLAFEDEGPIGEHRDRIEQTVRQTISAVNDRMPISDVLVRVVVDPSRVIPELGLSGYNPSEDEVILFVDPQSSVLPQSLANDLSPVLAHELHHAKRRRTVGYGSTLLEAIVSEGLADHFSMEAIGSESPLWARALTGSDLDMWTERAMETWTERPYDHTGWFVGTDPDIPRWTGYAIGFKLVGDYLSADPDRRTSRLVDEPAATFAPMASTSASPR